MKKIRTIVIIIFITSKLTAQVNIVANPSFEDTVHCPNNNAQMVIPSACKDWYDPNGSSADYFNSCSSNLVDIPNNFAGWQFARTGVAYAGIVIFSRREYIQEKLDSILQPSHTYCIEFYINLSNN